LRSQVSRLLSEGRIVRETAEALALSSITVSTSHGRWGQGLSISLLPVF